MTLPIFHDLSALIQVDTGQSARTIHLVSAAALDDWTRQRTARERAAMTAANFTAEPFNWAMLPGEDPDDWSVVTGLGKAGAADSWTLGRLASALPAGSYRTADPLPAKAMLGWLTGQYRFDRYKSDPKPKGPRILLTGDVAAIPGRVAEAEAVMLVRDLVNMPGEDMGPEALEAVAARLAKAYGATLTVTRDDALASGYPLIHAVGRAASKAHAPRLIELTWGRADAPRVAIIGKGISFDSGGLNIKPTAGMALMKKDMGGAAHALALARLIMASGLAVRLHCLVPAAENAIAGNSFRPGDVLTSRAGLSVAISNTDGEGRLVLADALTRAGEDDPAVVIDFATLTGAARVALGPDLPPLFSDDDALAEAIIAAGRAADDPLWRLPLWAPYAEMLKSDVADIDNSGSGGFAGAITAALFLKRFAPKSARWAHIDTFAWRPAALPGRPKGGEALGLRAVWGWLQAEYGAGRSG